MNLIVKGEVRCLKIGDIVVFVGDAFIVVRLIFHNGSEYALMNLEDGGYANGIHHSLEELEYSLERNYEIYSSDEYELVLQKIKKKC